MVTIVSDTFAPMRTGTYPRKATMTRILIVEDEESYREPLVYQLTREGYDVSAAATGEEGLELFTKGGIDLVHRTVPPYPRAKPRADYHAHRQKCGD